MSISDLRQELREIQGITRVAELTDGLLLIDGTKTGLIVHEGPRHTKTHSDTRLEAIAEEFDTTDYLLALIEGVAIVLDGTLDDFEISYLPAYTGGIERQNLITAVDELTHSKIKRESLPTGYFSATERDDVVALFERVLASNLTTYCTPKSVAYIAANWATAGGRRSVVDAACGSGELLTAAIDAIGEPSYSLGVDQNGLACALAESRIRKRNISEWQISADNFLTMFDEIAPNTQRSLSEYVASDSEPTSIPREGFDCVFAHPPEARVTTEDEQYYDSDITQFSRIEHQFVNAACRLLADSGRGCFVLPSPSIRNLRERVLPKGVVLKRLVKLPESAFPIVGVEPILVCVERTSNDTELGILNVASFTNLDQVCGAVHSPLSAERLDNVDSVCVQPDLPTMIIRTLLEAPGSAPFFCGNLPTLADVTERIATGMTTGHNPGFYFDEQERAESDIQDRFFTPVIKSIPKEGPVTDEHINHYLFDLREFVANHDLDERDVQEVVRALSAVDPAAATHVEEKIAPAIVEKRNLDGVLPYSISMTNPDLVTGSITSKVTWHRVAIDREEVLYDTTVVGISCDDAQTADSLLTLLNTPLYQRLNKTQLPNFDAKYVRVQIGPLQRLPILAEYLDSETLDQLRSLSPYESQESRETSRTVILEGIDSTHRSAVSKTYNAVSPLSTLTGYETQIEQLRAALDQVAEDGNIEAHLIDEEMIFRLTETFQSAKLFTSREELVAELLSVYSEDRYWSFMAGTVSQFDGMLQDYIENTGGEVKPRETENGNTRLHYQYRGDWKLLNLKILIDEFFSGNLSNVMQSVREHRNEIAHGRLLEEPESNADIVLLSFFIFTYALLNEYNEYLGAEKAEE